MEKRHEICHYPSLRKLKQELERMEALGVIAKVEEATPWSAGMVAVPKKNGSVRICVDLKPLNKYVLREFHPTEGSFYVGSYVVIHGIVAVGRMRLSHFAQSRLNHPSTYTGSLSIYQARCQQWFLADSIGGPVSAVDNIHYSSWLVLL